MTNVYEPPREDGTKAFVVTIWDWGRTTERVIWAFSSKEARAFARTSLGRYARIESVVRKQVKEPTA